MDPRKKISIGSALASLAGAGMVLSSLLGWSAIARPWGFILGFFIGLAAGTGVVLVISGLIERRRSA